MNTVILYEKANKQFTNDVAHTGDPTSTLKLLLQQGTNLVKTRSRLRAIDETMQKEGLTLEAVPQHMTDHRQ